MAADGLRFGVLGPLEMSAGGTVVRLGTPKQRAVLAMLVIRRNSAVGIDALLDAAWDQSPPPGARATLHQYMSNLRRVMADVGVDPHPVLVSAPPGYCLTVSNSQCDVGRFADEKTTGLYAAALGRFEQASQHLSAALSEWRGGVLEDLRDFSFIDAYASALFEEKVAVHTARAEAEIACGRAYSVIGELEALTTEYRYREPLWAQLITAYYLTERQADALGAYNQLRTTLADELGVDPGPTLRALHEKILRQEPLDVHKTARSNAEATLVSVDDDAIACGGALAGLRDVKGRLYRLAGSVTRVGRDGDNDIVLSDAKVSRKHAVIIDTGTSFVITDLHSANGVYVVGHRIGTSVTVNVGDSIRIGTHEFTLEASPRAPGDP